MGVGMKTGWGDRATGHRRTHPDPAQAGSTHRVRIQPPSPEPGSHWEPGETGPPWAEPLGIGGSWRVWALWLWGSPKGSGLFSLSTVWGGGGNPGAGTEVAGSPVALSKELGTELVSLRVAWKSLKLTKAWQGAEGSATLPLSEAS